MLLLFSTLIYIYMFLSHAWLLYLKIEIIKERKWKTETVKERKWKKETVKERKWEIETVKEN